MSLRIKTQECETFSWFQELLKKKFKIASARYTLISFDIYNHLFKIVILLIAPKFLHSPLWSIQLPPVPPLPQVPGNYCSPFCHLHQNYRFIHPLIFFLDVSILLHISIVWSFLLQNNIPLCEYNTNRLSANCFEGIKNK